jgi:hypothetical protein
MRVDTTYQGLGFNVRTNLVANMKVHKVSASFRKMRWPFGEMPPTLPQPFLRYFPLRAFLFLQNSCYLFSCVQASRKSFVFAAFVAGVLAQEYEPLEFNITKALLDNDIDILVIPELVPLSNRILFGDFSAAVGHRPQNNSAIQDQELTL